MDAASFQKNDLDDCLVSFRAGIMEMDKKSKWVRADKRKGLIMLRRCPEDRLMHFMWQDRERGVIETDLIIFPNEVTFRRVESCKTARVYLLEFKMSKQRLFFWLQEPSTERDDEYQQKINKYLSDPDDMEIDIDMEPSQTPSEPHVNREISNTQTAEKPSYGGQTDNSLLSQDVSGQSTVTASATSSTSSSEHLKKQIVNILQNISANSPRQSLADQFDLSDIVNAESITASGILDDPESLSQLQQYLPKTETDSVISTIKSYHFTSTVDNLNRALKQGQLTDLLKSFGLSMPKQPAPTSQLETFLIAIQEQSNLSRQK
ncbi:proteasomal ubiquitin receptor ADRM1 homolog [Schistocerca gregaria]|uniref:proteasomal ubiquitin receptor ADRM1 homolog n=1 Tax=Schistocerca gregaria TaxID=7010 RepID=UPI00211F3727|nr:proteasomal ubiquitin receptor ADRM1 homolog [Schistocerca gregaria]